MQVQLEELLEAVETRTPVLPNEEDFINHDRRTCDCELTYVHKKRHAALGTGIEIKLCCLAKFIERQFGLPSGTFYWAMDFEPTWEWDVNAEQVTKERLDDGSILEKKTRLGSPPEWLLKRMEKKGIAVKGLNEDKLQQAHGDNRGTSSRD